MDQSTITIDRRVRWGAPCVRNTGITVASVAALRRAGLSSSRILEVFPDLSADDLAAADRWFAVHGALDLGSAAPPPGARFPRLAVDGQVQDGTPVIRGSRVTVDAICGLREAGWTIADILAEYPALLVDDVVQALAYDAEVRRS